MDLREPPSPPRTGSDGQKLRPGGTRRGDRRGGRSPSPSPTMTDRSIRGAALLALLALAASATAQPDRGPDRGDGARVHWNDERFVPGDWPVGLAHATRAGVIRWAPLARELGYRMDLTRDGRVLTLSSARFNRSVRREDRLVRRTVAAFDRLADPAVEGADGSGRRLRAPVVLLRLHDHDDHEAAVDFLARTRPWLEGWASAAREHDGFHLREPSCSAWIERERGRDAENELVHRLTRCLTHARHGEPPAWLDRGLAWYVELEVCRSVRTLRDDVRERDWERALEEAFEGSRQLEMEDLASVRREGDDELDAGLSWGAVSFLASHHPDGLGPILRDLGRYAAEHGRVELEDGRFAARPDWEIPAGVQAHVLRRHVEGDLFAACADWFRAGLAGPRPRAR